MLWRRQQLGFEAHMGSYIDGHCHLDDASFDEDRDAVWERARAAGLAGAVLAGVSPETWARQRALASRYAGLVWTAGLHPCAVAGMSPVQLRAALDALPACFVGPNPARGLGELGLDTRLVERASLDRQLPVFRHQLAIARDRALPIVLHLNGRGVHAAALSLLRADGLPIAGGLVHAYSGSAELVAEYVALGLHLSFAATVCRADARKVHRAVLSTPADRLLVETDCPDQSPPGCARRNEPQNLLVIADAIARIRSETSLLVLERSRRALIGIFPAAFPL